MYRLYGIDAPDDGQICPDGWPAAYEAEAYLGQSIGEKTVTCMPIGLPRKTRRPVQSEECTGTNASPLGHGERA